MISKLHLHQIGPAPDLEAEFGERLNLITGDNGLGKTFLLDACWSAFTRTGSGGAFFNPRPEASKNDPPRIDYTIIDQTGHKVEREMKHNFAHQTWRTERATLMSNLVIYVRVDGGFSVWDPNRNYVPYELEELDEDTGSYSPLQQRPPAFQFSNKDVWEGLDDDAEDRKKTICNGLLRDVETWRLKRNGAFQLLQKVLKGISSGDEETLSIGESVRVHDDVKDIPTIIMPYGPVPVTLAAAGMRRVLALAYMLVWAWDEHCRACESQKEETTDRVVLLFDEVEAHLHPKRQRVFLTSLLEVVQRLLFKSKPQSVQIIATTHAPLVLASVESVWNAQHDRLFDFKLVEGKRVCFEQVEFARQGSASNWLTSGSFDLPSDYAVAAEKAMSRADALMRQYPRAEQAPREEIESAHNALKGSLGGDDEYWPYWLPYYETTTRAV